MSYILSTTYPSIQGLGAAEFACGLATALDCPVRLLHTYTVPIILGEIPLPAMSADDAYTLAAGQMDAAIAKLRVKYPNVNISSTLNYGELADVLDEAAQDAPPLLTIIGNDEETGPDGWIGNNATSILRKAAYPVLAVPYAAVYRKPTHICLAGDRRSIVESVSVQPLLYLQAVCNFQITVLHILDEGETPVVFSDSALGKQLARNGVAYIEMPASGAVDSTIANYAAAHNVDWLSIIPHHYGFWEGLFHKSHTAHMLHLAHLPILALH